jgi:hypothetical protein
MRPSKKRTGLLITVELGADWPEAVSVAGNGAVRRVVAQEEGETPEAFAGRLGKLAGRLFHPGVELRDAVVACNERTDPAAAIARRSIGATLLERMGPSGTFVFAAGARAGGRLRHALSALAIDLAPEASATVTVHFGAERHEASERADALRVA